MTDLTKYFIVDKQTYQDKGVVMYNFDETKSDKFLEEFIVDFRKAYVSDDTIDFEMNEEVSESREEVIAPRLPELPYMKSGEFAEILYFYIAQTYLVQDADIVPIKWQWKENNNMPCHLSDIIIMRCPDRDNPSPEDYMFMMEIKSGATPLPNKSDKSKMNEAIKGAVKDMTSRAGKLVSYLKAQYVRDRNAQMAKRVQRFAEGIEYPPQKKYSAAVLVDRRSVDKHIVNITDENLRLAKSAKIALFVIPMTDLRNRYEEFYNLAPKKG